MVNNVMRQPAYDYHPTDAEYISQNGLSHIRNYIQRIVACNRIGAPSFVDGVREAYRLSGTIRASGKLLGVSYATIERHAKMIGITLDGRWGNRSKKTDRSYKYAPEDAPFSPIHFYPEKLKISQDLGYPSLKSGVIGVYIETNSMRETAKVFDVCQQSIHKMLEKFGIERNGAGGPNRTRAKTYLKECNHHGLTEFYESCHICQKCRQEIYLAKKTGGQNV